MEAAPPSYQSAVAVDPWDLIARYVPSNDLCSATRVCSSWHSIFTPHLWGNPASHFGIEDDQVYIALTKFKRTLQTARLFVRLMTHTLHLPPAHAELYNGPHADWLRDLLERLPNLQSLIVRGLPFFDHASLQALRFSKPSQANRSDPPGVIELPGSNGYVFEASSSSTSFGLRLLDCSRCSNATGIGLVQALSRFESLLYLDLSFTYAARELAVLSSLRRLSGLQVLRLRGINLTDNSIETLATAIRLRVRSLDIRDNQISDRGVRMLIDNCFASGDLIPPGGRTPALLPYLGGEMLQTYQGEDFEGYLRSTFTKGFVSRLAIEDVPEGGITHLYISGNRLSVEGASGLIRSCRLHVFDMGHVFSDSTRYSSLSKQHNGHTEFKLPGVEKLTPVLAKYGCERLTFLRIDHGIVTEDFKGLYAEKVVPDRIELGDTNSGGLLSPVCAFGEGPMSFSGNDMTPVSPNSNSGSPISSMVTSLGVYSRPRGYSSVGAERRTRLATHTRGDYNLHPAMIPHVSTLVLTDVPASSPNLDCVNRIISFIKNCAKEEAYAKAQAHLDYALPPGRKGHASALKQSSDKIFALKRLILEMASEKARRRNNKASPWQHDQTKSVTEDRDTESLWSAAETDFSFFGDDDESNYPSLEPGSFAYNLNSREKEISYRNGSNIPPFDTIAILSEFRKERKLAHQHHRMAGVDDEETEGYWSGLVQVVRPNDDLRSDEEVEIYGNRFRER
ncbi:hypothetical protein M433DRAFT_67932 [Acidomyces richmondensis BFW]|nr:MAG: hypothetical protein FE78DRAFT_149058 [Acidomyces sp. 'richmondensis']KYG45152.1 hypothetical protein M433DRAFT_67932 [Acidomyces richmondensis BFW]